MGLLSFALKVFPLGLPFIRQLYDELARKARCVSSEIREGLSW